MMTYAKLLNYFDEPECTVSAFQEVRPGIYEFSITFHVDGVREDFEIELTTRQANTLMRKYDAVVFNRA